MTLTRRVDGAVAQAATDGAAGRERHRDGFRLRRLRGPDEFEACVELQREVWGATFAEVVPSGILRVVQYVGGVAAGAFTPDGRLVGFVFGVSGVRRGRLSHWSDTLAVHADYRSHGLGERLKRYQRRLLLPLGIERVYWTFDPLESRNGYLNFTRLGVVSSEYKRDFYGPSSSDLHDLIGTDRIVVQWKIRGRRARYRLAGEPYGWSGDIHALRAIPAINGATATPAGPQSGEPRLDLEAPRVRLAIPADIQSVKQAAPELAVEWRRVTRAALESYFRRGYAIHEFMRDGDCSNYILELAGHLSRERASP